MPASLASLRRTADLFDTGAAILGPDGRLLHLNPAAERLLGRSTEEFRGGWLDAAFPAGAHDRPEWLSDVSAPRDGSLGVFPVQHPDGHLIPVEIGTRVVRRSNGEPRFVLATIRDVSAQLEQLNASALAMLGTPGDDMLVTIIQVARNLVGARYAALGVVEDGRLVRFIPDGMPAEEVAGIDHPPDGQGLLGALIAEQRTVRLADIRADPRRSGFPPGHPLMHSFLGTPIKAGDEVYGHLYFTDKVGASTFSFVDERLAELFASHAAIAIRDQRRRDHLEATLDALRRSERNLAEAQRVARMGSWEWDLATDRLHKSDETFRIYGIAPGTFAGTNEAYLAFVHPDDLARVLEADRRTLASGTPFEVDFRIVRPDGAVRTVHEVGEVIRDETGHPGRMVGTTQDITEQVAAEEERARLEERLRLSERNLAEAQRIARLGSWEWDFKTDVLTESDEACRILGIEPGTFGGSAEILQSQFIHPDDRDRIHDADRASIEEGALPVFDYRIIRPDGAVRIIHEVGQVIRDEAGNPARMVGTIQDITEQVAAEEERARLVSAVEQTADSIVVADPDGTIRYVNPAFTRLYGYEPDEVVGRNACLLNSHHHARSFWTEMFAAVSASGIWSGTIVNRRKDGTLVEVESVVSGIRDAAGRITSHVQADRDVTRVRELEERLRQAQKMEAIGQLAGGIAHDFNNILTAIRGYGELARDPAASEDQRRADLDEIVANADRAAELTRGLLAFGRRAVLRPEILDPAAIVDGIVPLLRRLIGEHIRLGTSAAPGVGQVRVDRSQLEQVIVNLCVNARDAMPEGGRLTIATAAVELDEADAARIAEATPGSYVELTVADTGTGMDEATRAHIFEPFFTTKPTGEGTGLGLATVYGIVHQSGGTIAVESEPGRGTTFRILLPVVEAERGEASPSDPAPAAAGGSETILLVEDEAAVRGFTRRALADHGYTVIEASDGAAALHLASTHPQPIDLLLTDVVMPGLAGPDLARLVSDMQPTIRVLYVSGYVASAVDPASFYQSASLAKPFTTEALLRKVRETLDPPGEG